MRSGQSSAATTLGSSPCPSPGPLMIGEEQRAVGYGTRCRRGPARVYRDPASACESFDVRAAINQHSGARRSVPFRVEHPQQRALVTRRTAEDDSSGFALCASAFPPAFADNQST
jgi:hypothetical protein